LLSTLTGSVKMVFNYSKDSDYHTQLNNRRLPLSTCNTTSMIMALKQAGVEPPGPLKGDKTIYLLEGGEDVQPEDYFTDFLRSPAAYGEMKELCPWFFDAETGKALVAPNEVHQMLEWGVNTLLKRQVDEFSTEVPIPEIVAHLMKGGGVVLSGKFRLKNRTLNHIVSLAGFVTGKNEDITHFIIDDPYGNFRTDYKDQHGNNIRITRDEFIAIFNPTGNEGVKWAHLLS
jgi:hypothetical protein